MITRRELLEVFEENKGVHPSHAIYVWLDTVTNEFLYFDGNYSCGYRGTDHRALWCHLDDETTINDLYETYRIMAITPESEHILMDFNDQGLFDHIIAEHFEGFKIEYLGDE